MARCRARGHRGRLAPGQFRDFGLSVGVPEGEPGDALGIGVLGLLAGAAGWWWRAARRGRRSRSRAPAN